MANTCKYYKQQKQVSYNQGQTWSNLNEFRMGTLYESDSEDCGAVINMYRWINLNPSTDYYCSGTTKYYKQQKQVSYDDGTTWENVSPSEYQWGGIAETQSTDCGYVPPTPISGAKLSLTSIYGQTCSASCDSTSAVTTGDTWTISCFNYTEVTYATIGDCVTSIGNQAFKYYYRLKNIYIPNSVTSIGSGAFINCYGITNIDIPSGVTSINNSVFGGCSHLTSIVIPSGVTSIGNSAFRSCSRLTSIVIPSGVTSIGNTAFEYCSGLTKFNSDVNGVLNIPTNVTKVSQGVFRHCNGFSSVIIHENVVSIDSQAFYNCYSLTSVTIYATTPPTLGSDVFLYTSCPIYVPAASVDTYKSASGWSTYANRIQAIPT